VTGSQIMNLIATAIIAPLTIARRKSLLKVLALFPIAIGIIVPLIIAKIPPADKTLDEIDEMLEELPWEQYYPNYTRKFIQDISKYAPQKCNPDPSTPVSSLSTIPDCNQDGLTTWEERILGYLLNNKNRDNNYAPAIAKIPNLIKAVKSQKINFLPIGECHGKKPIIYILELMRNLQKEGYTIIFVGEYSKSPAFDEFNRANIHDKENKIDPQKSEAVVEKFLTKDRIMSLYLKYEYNSRSKLKALFTFLKRHRIPVYPLEGSDKYNKASFRDQKMSEEIKKIYSIVRKKYPNEKIILMGSFGAAHVLDIRPKSHFKIYKYNLNTNNTDPNYGILHYLSGKDFKTLPINFTTLFTSRELPYKGAVHVN